MVADFGRVPLLAHYLPDGLTYVETTGPVVDPRTSDQRNGTARLRAAVTSVTLGPSIDGLEPGRHLLVVCTAGELPVDATEFLRLIVLRCNEALAMAVVDARFRLQAAVGPTRPSETPVNGYLFEKMPAPA